MQKVSIDPLNPDYIKVKINGNLFKDPIKGTLIDTSVVMEQVLPRQMNPDQAQEFANRVDTANEATTFCIVVNILIQLFMKQSLKTIWGIVNIL